MEASPARPLTFLFTDIEGSTHRWEAHGDDMERAVARHDELLRNAIEQCNGRVFKTVGDAFCAWFYHPQDATKAALSAQRALLASDFSAVNDIRVRMAVHTGVAHERDNDYFGPALNRVARLLSLGHGGQVLVSGATAELINDELPEDASVRDLGAHRLKDLDLPERVFQLVAPDLPQTFPALRSLGGRPNNIPRQLTSFVGRDDVLTSVEVSLGSSPIVTIVGEGGGGKTRCAIQAGTQLLDQMSDGVWFVELAPVTDPSLVAAAIAGALGVREVPNISVSETLLGFLERKQLLLILDNCEHVIEEVRRIAAEVVRRCARVSIVATSREALNVAGETSVRIPPLTSEAALQLFVDRAVAVDPRFVHDERNGAFIEEICRRLDGLPLAIELAAARVKVLSPKQLVAKLDQRFRVLTGGDRSALPHHQTLQAVIDWSYDLLSDSERRLFRRLSVFAGNFSLEPVTAVCSGDEDDDIAMLDGLSSLLDKSLLRLAHSDDDARYNLLESTRQYARQKLQESGEYEAIAQAHAAAYLAIAESVNTFEETIEGASSDETDNWRLALEWMLARGHDILGGQRLVAALRNKWIEAPSEGSSWVTAAIERIDGSTPTEVVASLSYAQARLDLRFHRFDACRTQLAGAVERYRAVSDLAGVAASEMYAALAASYLGDAQSAKTLLQDALSIVRGLDSPRLNARVRHSLGIVLHEAGEIPAARALYEEAFEIYRRVGAPKAVANLTASLAELAFIEGDAVKAAQLAAESMAKFESANLSFDAALAASNLAAYLVFLKRYDEALSVANKPLQTFRDTTAELPLAFAIQHVAAATALKCASSSALMAQAARLIGFADGRFSARGITLQFTERQEFDKALSALRDSLDLEELTRCMSEGRDWTESQAADAARELVSHHPN